VWQRLFLVLSFGSSEEALKDFIKGETILFFFHDAGCQRFAQDVSRNSLCRYRLYGIHAFAQ
jgi:hypothetical protein